MTARKPVRIGVVGLGDYYSKLSPWMSKEFDQIVLVDSCSAVPSSVPRELQSRFRSATDPMKIASLLRHEQLDGILLLIPPEPTGEIASTLLKEGHRVLLEKPFGRSASDLSRVVKEARSRDHLLLSDYYRDLRILPLLAICQRRRLARTEQRFIRRTPESTRRRRIDLAATTEIVGHLKETSPLIAGEWRSNPECGGVVRDLMVHLLASVFRLFPGSYLDIQSFAATARNDSQAESEASLAGYLQPGSRRVRLEVGKGSASNSRFLALFGPGFSARQSFEGIHEACLERNGRRTVSSSLCGSHYELAAKLWRGWLSGHATCMSPGECRELVSILDALRSGYEEPASRPDATPQRATSRWGTTRRWIVKHAPYAVVSLCTFAATLGRQAFDVFDEATGGEHRVLEGLRRRAHALLDAHGPPEVRLETLRRLFFLDDPERRIAPRTIIPPAGSYLDSILGQPESYGYETFPHEAASMAAFKAIAGDSADEIVEGAAYREYADSRTRFICFGSPVANELTRLVFPLEVEGKRQTHGLYDPTRIPYRMVVDRDEPDIRVFSAMLGREKLKKRKAILEPDPNGGSIRHALATGDYVYTSGKWKGWLRSDRLIVSKLPTNLEGGSMLLIGGGHGSGTEAFRLLLDRSAFESTDLIDLERLLQGWQYFQIVFEVEEIYHKTSGSRPGRLKVSTRLPPRRVHLSPELFYDSELRIGKEGSG